MKKTVTLFMWYFLTATATGGVVTGPFGDDADCVVVRNAAIAAMGKKALYVSPCYSDNGGSLTTG